MHTLLSLFATLGKNDWECFLYRIEAHFPEAVYEFDKSYKASFLYERQQGKITALNKHDSVKDENMKHEHERWKVHHVSAAPSKAGDVRCLWSLSSLTGSHDTEFGLCAVSFRTEEKEGMDNVLRHIYTLFSHSLTHAYTHTPEQCQRVSVSMTRLGLGQGWWSCCPDLLLGFLGVEPR